MQTTGRGRCSVVHFQALRVNEALLPSIGNQSVKLTF
jgi:hypothetical protein